MQPGLTGHEVRCGVGENVKPYQDQYKRCHIFSVTSEKLTQPGVSYRIIRKPGKRPTMAKNVGATMKSEGSEESAYNAEKAMIVSVPLLN